MKTRNAMSPTLLAATVAAVTLHGAALADGYGNTADAVPNPSWYVFPSIDAIGPDHKFIDHHGEGGGLRLGLPLSAGWDVQFGATFSRASNADYHYHQNTLGVDAVYLFSRGDIRPLLLVGIGSEYDRVEAYGTATGHTSPFINAGLGIQYGLSDQWGAQLDARRAHAYLHGDAFGFRRANTNTVTLGLTYAFDKPPARTAVAYAAPVAVATNTPPPAPPAPMAAPAAPRFERYTLRSTELFDFDSSALKMPQAKLDEIADALNRNPQLDNVVITGFTDRIGSNEYNVKLSQRRADAVRDYLISKSVDGSRLITSAKGEGSPLVDCNDTQRAKLIDCLEPNRRVEMDQIVIERRVK